MKTEMLLIFVLISIGLALLATAIYVAIYKSSLAKKLARGIVNPEGSGNTSSGKHWTFVSPLRFFLITVIAFCVLSVVFFVIGKSATKKPVALRDPIISVCDENSLTASFTPGQDIPGYSMHEKKEGKIHVIYYVNNAGSKDAFPPLLFYMDKTSDPDSTCSYTLQWTPKNKKAENTQKGTFSCSYEGHWFVIDDISDCENTEVEFSNLQDSVRFAF